MVRGFAEVVQNSQKAWRLGWLQVPEHAGDRYPGHDGLGVLPHPEPGDVGEHAVLAEPGGHAGGEDDGHEETEVYAWGYVCE